MSVWRLKLCAIGLIIVAVFRVWSAPAIGQAAPPPVPTATSPGATINAYIAYYVAILQGNDTTAQSSARQMLITGASAGVPGGQPAVAGGYFLTYTSAVNSSFDKLLKDPKSNVRAHLNAGIVTCSLAVMGSPTGGGAPANAAATTNLVPTVMDLLADKSPANLLWGVKATEPVMRALANGTPISPADIKVMSDLAKGVIDSVRPESSSSEVVDAYKAIMAGWPPTIPIPQAQTVLLPFVQNLVNKRIGQYVSGDLISPDADGLGMIFLGDTWNVQNPTQCKATMQLVSDMISVVGQRGSKLTASNNDRTSCINLLKGMPLALVKTPAAQIVAPLGNLQPTTTPTTIAQLSTAASAAIKSNPTWGPLAPAPTIVGTVPPVNLIPGAPGIATANPAQP